MGGLMMMGMMGGGQNSGKMMPAFFQLNALGDTLWTKGQTVSVAGHEFLVAYRLNTGLDPASMGGPEPKLAASLTLSLIRTDTVISISPDPTLTGDQLRKTLTLAGVEFDTTPLHMDTGGSDDAIQAAVLFPVFAQAKQAAKETVSLSNVKQIALSALLYTSDYDDVYPYVQGTDQFRQVTKPYARNDEIWKDPNPNGGGYRFAMNLAGVSATSIEEPAKAPMVYETNAWPDGKRVVGFADGHARRVTNSQWAEIEQYLKKRYPKKAKKPIKIG